MRMSAILKQGMVIVHIQLMARKGNPNMAEGTYRRGFDGNGA